MRLVWFNWKHHGFGFPSHSPALPPSSFSLAFIFLWQGYKLCGGLAARKQEQDPDVRDGKHRSLKLADGAVNNQEQWSHGSGGMARRDGFEIGGA